MPSHIGKYEIRREIGRGGSGSVYEGYDPDVDRRVAIKVLHTSGDLDTIKRFRQEATSAGNLRHKNIVTIYDSGEYDGAAFIVMEYLEGEDLQRIIHDGAPLTLLEKIQIMREVAEGLDYAHSKGVAHRDVKPANIKVQPDRSVKIMDFGTARLLRETDSRLTKTGFVLGTPQYMAPEQFTGADSGPKADIYAYGAIYYELISGKAPFAASDTAKLMYRVLEGAPAPLSSLVPDCPPALEALILRAMEKDPELRYQSMQDVLLDSDAILGELGLKQATLLVEKAHKLLDARLFESAQANVAEALKFDPGNKEVQRLFAEVRQRRQLQQRSGSPPAAPAKPELAPEAPPPRTEDPPARLPEPGEFTRLFHTAPSPQAKVPTSQESAAPQSVPEDATRLFAVTFPGTVPGQSLTDHSQTPTDTVLTIANCTDAAFLNAKAGLDHFPFTIGRGGADWNLAFDPAISARHVEIDYREGGFFIRDLGSSNGAFVNGRRLKKLEPELLLFGARILLGSNTEIVFGSSVLKEIPNLSGTLIGNRFTLLEKLHSSSKSVLYLANDENLPRKVAVKLLSPSLISHTGYREQFSREAHTASLLRHSRICQILDYGELRLSDPPGGRTLYVCMEFLPAGSFQSRLNRPDPFPLPQIGSWLDTICDALAYVHKQGVVHSGIKPSAIVFDTDENPYLTDFAFATRPGQGSRQSVVGSPAFLAPEQWEGAAAVPATDLYSLAVLFYWLIAGCLPFEGQEHVVVRNRNFLRGPMPVHEMVIQNGRPAVPDRISSVFQQALAVDLKARFASAPEFASAFRSALMEPAPVRSRPASVFVSYQRAESSLLADMIKKEIERESGYQVFVDAVQQDSSGQFPLKLRRRIQQCDAFICLLGRSTLAPDWVNLEIQVAAEHTKPMIPVFQESYRPRNVRELDPPVQQLLTYEGVKILDQQNLFVDAAIQSLIALTRRSIEHPEPRVHIVQLPETAPEGLMSRLLAFARRLFRLDGGD